MRVGIVSEGGPTEGMGHLYRAGRIASTLTTRGHEVTGLTASPEHMRQVFPSDVEFIHLSDTATVGQVREWIELTNPPVEVLLIDKPEIPLVHQQQFAESSAVVGLILDGSGQTVCCDLVINGHIYVDRNDYDHTGQEPVWCIGGEYQVFDPALRDFASQEPPWRDPPERLLILMGGSDPRNSMPRAIRAIDGLDITATAVIGPGFENESEIRQAEANIGPPVNIIRDPDDLAERMFEADLAVTALGLTAYELLAVGTPFVGIPQAVDQRPKAEALETADCATVLQADATTTEIRREISDLIEDSARRRRYQTIGRELIQGDGTDRIASRLEAIA